MDLGAARAPPLLRCPALTEQRIGGLQLAQTCIPTRDQQRIPDPLKLFFGDLYRTIGFADLSQVA